MKKVLLIVFILSAASLSGCIDLQYIGPDEPTDHDVTIAIMDNESVNPSSHIILPNIFEGLVTFDATFQITPGLAESWSTPDEYTWRFKLRENVRFHNDKPMTAEDVGYTFEIWSQYGGIVQNVTILDEYTIDISTIEQMPGFLQRIAYSVYIVPDGYYEGTTDFWPVGTGAYQLVDYVANEYTRLEKFDGYWGARPEIDSAMFEPVIDQEKRVQGILNGSYDICSYNVDQTIRSIEEDANISIVVFPPLSTYSLGFDLRVDGSAGFADGENPTADIRVRKAIYHAINITPLIDGPFQGYAVPATQLLTPYIFGYNPNIKRLPYDIGIARELMIEAGYEEGFDIQLDTITTNFEYNIENTLLIAEQLRRIGINVTVNGMSKEDFNKKVVIEKNTSLWLVGWGTSSIDGESPYRLFIMTDTNGSQGAYNSWYYSNPEVDRLGREAALEMNVGSRLHQLQEGFEIAYAVDIISVPLFSQELFLLTLPDMKVQPRADTRLILKDIRFVQSA